MALIDAIMSSEAQACATHKLNELYTRWWASSETQALCDGILQQLVVQAGLAGEASLASAQMLVVSDITDLFLPIPDELLVNLSDSRSVVEALLDSLPEMFANTRNVESAMGPAVEAAYKVMRHIGGKMVVMQSSLPSLGAGRLRHRENPKMLGGELEHTLLAAGSPYVAAASCVAL